MPLVDSIMEMQDFWSGKYFSAVERKVTREQLFDLDVAREAQARLAKEQPFARKDARSLHAEPMISSW
jgi:hypothetical protein